MTTTKMSKKFIKQHLKKSKFKHKCCGSIDENGFLIKTNCYHWLKDNGLQKYYGELFYNNLHNKGIYIIDKPGNQVYYDGLFFCNKLEGYGKVVYNDGKIFEGLFKKHNRFGPGILTHQDNTQDVGIWDGFSLRRLIVSIGSDYVPRLGKTSLGKARLLKYRNLVPICEKRRDLAEEILIDLEAEELLSKSDELYNLKVRNPDSLVFNSKLYFDNFIQQNCNIDVLITEEEFDEYSNHSTPKIDKDNCSCFQPQLDYFTHLANQMQEIETKIQKLTQQISAIDKQISRCKNCCKKEQQIVKHISTAKPDLVISDQIATITLSRSISSDSLESDPEPQEPATHSEIELHNYLYTHSAINAKIDMGESEKPGLEKISKATLPFNYRLSTDKVIHYDKYLQELNLDQYNEIEEEESEINEISICRCRELNFDNFDNLEKKLKVLRQEEIFYNSVKKIIKKHLDVEFDKLEQLIRNQKRFIKQVPITDLVAWNNEPIWISVLQHTFHYRNYENYVSFNVKDLLAGYRYYFDNPGSYEKNCRKFLENCGDGDETNVLKSLQDLSINPNLCDSRGNSGVMLAAVRNKIEVIKILVNFGAKLDTMNDEGLTPLTICLLKYISIKFKVINWEEAYLLDFLAVDNTYSQWRPTESLTSLYKQSIDNLELNQNDSKTIIQENPNQKQDYIFNLNFIKIPKPKKTKKPKKSKKPKKTKKPKKAVDTPIIDKTQLIDDEIKNKLKSIKTTILILLKYGSDPNIGRVPLEALFLSIFTDDADCLWEILRNHVDPNTTTDQNLTSLHIIASLKPSIDKIKMCEILLDFGADPNITTNRDHWQELKPKLLGSNIKEIDNEGKNVLHLLCLREDFIFDNDKYLCEIAKVLVFAGCSTKDFYLGHTPLSIAVFRGNLNLIETLLSTGLVDPYQTLGNNMGNALSILTLNRYKSILSDQEKISVAQVLIDNGLNPLHEIEACDNIVTFIEHESMKKKPEKKRNKSSKKKKSSRASSKKKKSSLASSKKKSSKASKNKQAKLSIDKFLIKISKEFLCRYLQAKAINSLYFLLSAGLDDDSLVEILKKFLKETKTLDILHLLFQTGIINHKWFSEKAVCRFLEFTKKQDNLELTIHEKNVIHQEVSLRKWDFQKTNLTGPEIDRNFEKYQICYNCLKRFGKKLLLCPNCGLIYFCSQQCNKISNKIDNWHHCKILFYDSVDKIIQDSSQPNRLELLLKAAYKLFSEKLITERNLIRSSKRSFFGTSSMIINKKSSVDINKKKSNLIIPMSLLPSSIFPIQSIKQNLSELRTNSVTLKTNSRNFSTINTLRPLSRGDSFRKKPEVMRYPGQDLNSQAKIDTRKIVEKNRYYMEILSKIFADFNLPLVLLPYACFKDGQVFYSMNGNKSHFGSDFCKINFSTN